MRRKIIIIFFVLMISLLGLYLFPNPLNEINRNTLNINDSRVDEVIVVELEDSVLEIKYHISESTGISPPFELSIGEELLSEIEEKIGMELYTKGYNYYKEVIYKPYFKNKKLEITIY